MNPVRRLNTLKWVTLGAFVAFGVAQLVLVSLLRFDDSNPVFVSIGAAPADPSVAAALVVLAVCLHSVVLTLNTVRLLRDPSVRMLYPTPEEDGWACRYQCAQIVEWVLARARQAGVSVSRIYLVDSPIPNAMTISLPFIGTVVVLYSNALDFLGPEEVQAIVAHELGHVANHDSFIALLASLPAVSVLVAYAYVWLVLVTGVMNALLMQKDLLLALVRLAILGVVFLLSRAAIWVSTALSSTASRIAEHLADISAARQTSLVDMVNALVHLGQRTEAMSVLLEEVEWLESRDPMRRGPPTVEELLVMVKEYPRTAMDERTARELAPALYLMFKLKHLRRVYEVALTDDQIRAAVEPAAAALLKERRMTQADTAPPVPTVDWRTIDTDSDHRLSEDEIRTLVKELKEHPGRFLFEAQARQHSMTSDHPSYAQRVLVLVDAVGL